MAPDKVLYQKVNRLEHKSVAVERELNDSKCRNANARDKIDKAEAIIDLLLDHLNLRVKTIYECRYLELVPKETAEAK